MATQVDRETYEYMVGERDRFVSQANMAAAERDRQEGERAHAQRFADQLQAVLSTVTVAP